MTAAEKMAAIEPFRAELINLQKKVERRAHNIRKPKRPATVFNRSCAMVRKMRRIKQLQMLIRTIEAIPAPPYPQGGVISETGAEVVIGSSKPVAAPAYKFTLPDGVKLPNLTEYRQDTYYNPVWSKALQAWIMGQPMPKQTD